MSAIETAPISDERERLPSASGMERLALCPGSFLLEYDHGEKTTSDDAALGNRIHDWLAWRKVALTPEEQEIADACDTQANQLMTDWLGTGGPSKVEIIREQRLWARDADGLERVWSGKPDAVIIAEDPATGTRRALVIDYKTGRGDVTQAAGNMQLRALAVLVAEEFVATSIRVAIVQPLAGCPTVCDYDDIALAVAKVEIDAIVKRATAPGQERKPSPSACKYCSAKAACPEGRRLVTALAEPIPRSFGAMLLTPEEMAGFLHAARAAEAIIESVRDKARRMLEADEKAIPGWRLKPGVARESITNPQLVFDRVAALGATPERFLGAVTVAKGKLESIVRELTGEKGKGLKARMDDILDGAAETKHAAPSLAPEKEAA